MKNNLEERLLILTIESSGPTCSVALAAGEDIIGEYAIYGQNLHDKLLAELAGRLLSDSDVNIDDIHAVAVSSGPGSFTGLRIGGAVAKGLCFGGRPALVGVPSLAALAWSARETASFAGCNRILASILSWRDNIYYQEYDFGGNPTGEVVPAKLKDLEEFKMDNVFAVGTSFAKVGGFKTTADLNIPTARSTARLGYIYYKKGEITLPEDFAPLYVQDFKPRTGK